MKLTPGYLPKMRTRWQFTICLLLESIQTVWDCSSHPTGSRTDTQTSALRPAPSPSSLRRYSKGSTNSCITMLWISQGRNKSPQSISRARLSRILSLWPNLLYLFSHSDWLHWGCETCPSQWDCRRLLLYWGPQLLFEGNQKPQDQRSKPCLGCSQHGRSYCSISRKNKPNNVSTLWFLL